MVQVPGNVATEELPEEAFDYRPVKGYKSAGDPDDISVAVKALLGAKNPLIYAGQGIFWAEASKELQELAELTNVPVMTTNTGKSAFPENHPLSVGTGAGGAEGKKGDGAVAAEIKQIKDAWLGEWMPLLTSGEVPINPYRVIWDVMHTVDRTQTIVTHDSGHPRDQTIPFYESIVPRGYLGWGNSSQLGYGLGLAMGAKLGAPDTVHRAPGA